MFIIRHKLKQKLEPSAANVKVSVYSFFLQNQTLWFPFEYQIISKLCKRCAQRHRQFTCKAISRGDRVKIVALKKLYLLNIMCPRQHLSWLTKQMISGTPCRYVCVSIYIYIYIYICVCVYVGVSVCVCDIICVYVESYIRYRIYK